LIVVVFFFFLAILNHVAGNQNLETFDDEQQVAVATGFHMAAMHSTSTPPRKPSRCDAYAAEVDCCASKDTCGIN